jgi:hypothetical protein
MLTATVSGSFHRHMGAISAAVYDLASFSVRVLSPADPRIVAAQGQFLFVASDPVGSIRLVQDRHLDCIRAADFVWLVCPDGYVGPSASLEIGYAAAAGVPILSAHQPTDITLREYVKSVPSLAEGLRLIAENPRTRQPQGVLIDPHASIEEAHAILERVEKGLTRNGTFADPAVRVYGDLADLQQTLMLPTRLN